MTRTIYNKYPKTLIPQLERAVFKGRIFVITTEREAEKAVAYLLAQSVLGVDTETKPSFKRGTVHLVSLLQVSTPDTCFLFRLNTMQLTPAIKRLLEDTTVPKIGLSLKDDLLALHKRGDFTPGKFIDLQHLVGDIGIEDMSLQKIFANLFQQKISKTAQLSNWNADTLSDSQKLYAATDAWACIEIYQEVLKLKESGEYKVVTDISLKCD